MQLTLNTPSFNKHGFVDAIFKGIKVLGWHLSTNAILVVGTVGLELAKNIKIEYPNYAIYMAVAIAGINGFIVFMTKWLGTHKPSETVIETPVDTTPVIG